MTTNQISEGQMIRLPDGPYGEVVKVEEGTEYGAPVLYVTVENRLGQLVTRWIAK